MRTIIQFFNNLIIPLLPETRGFAFKRFLWKLAGVQLGENVKLCSSVKILGSGKLSIGRDTWIGPQVMICVTACVEIGNNCDIAPRVYIGDGTHLITNGSQRIAAEQVAIPVKIGDGCWICANSTILAGVYVANKCVVAAGSVLTHSFDEDSILIAGIPAKYKKSFNNVRS